MDLHGLNERGYRGTNYAKENSQWHVTKAMA